MGVARALWMVLVKPTYEDTGVSVIILVVISLVVACAIGAGLVLVVVGSR